MDWGFFSAFQNGKETWMMKSTHIFYNGIIMELCTSGISLRLVLLMTFGQRTLYQLHQMAIIPINNVGFLIFFSMSVHL